MEWRCAGIKSRRRVDAVAVLCQNLALAFLMVAGTVDVLMRAVAFLTSFIVGLRSGKQRSHQGQQNERGHGTPPKIPQVASIVVTETAQDEVSHERLVDLLFWCTQAGMRYLFVYDPKGFVKENPERVRDALKLLNKHAQWEFQLKIGWQPTKSIPPPTAFVDPLKGGSGVSANDSADEDISLQSGQVVIHLLARSDSLLPLTKTVATVEIGGERDTCEVVDNAMPPFVQDTEKQTSWRPVVSTEESSLQQQPMAETTNSVGGKCEYRTEEKRPSEESAIIDPHPGKCSRLETRPVLKPPELKKQVSRLFGNSAILEPSLLFVVGHAHSLAGCPPWHARFSEIYFLGPCGSVTKKHFEHALSRFMRTNQRFGV